MASRLHETSIRKLDGEWILPTAADVYEDYMLSTGSEIRLPKAAEAYLRMHPEAADGLIPSPIDPKRFSAENGAAVNRSSALSSHAGS